MNKTFRLLTLAFAISLFGACTKTDTSKESASKSQSSKKKSGNVFVVCTEGSPGSLNPSLLADGITNDASGSAVYNQLFQFKNGETTVIPVLVKEWKVSDDGLEYTFKLRQDVEFHSSTHFTPTRKMNADDVMFSYYRQADKKHPYHMVGGGVYEFYEAMGTKDIIKDLIKIDDHTVKFLLHSPNATFLPMIAMEYNSVYSKEYADKMMAAGTPEKVDMEPIGTGPFVFKRYDKDSMIRYSANEKYFRGRVKVDGMVFLITPDHSVRTQKLRAGECHFNTNPATTDLELMEKDPDVKVLSDIGLNIGYFAMNVQKKPFDNVKVRQAIAYALNRQAYIDAVYLGQAEVAKNPMPPSIWGYNEDTRVYEHSPEKAKALLKEAGFPDGFETELWSLPVARLYIPNGKKLAEMMQADLAKVGIKTKIVTYDWPTYLKKTGAGEHPTVQLGWMSDNGDPDNFLKYHLSCGSIESGENRARWCDKEYDDLVVKAGQITDQAKRTELYKKAQKRFGEQVPWVPLAYAKTFKAMTNNVHGYVIHPLGSGNFFEHVELK